jgi:hypothetical protein
MPVEPWLRAVEEDRLMEGGGMRGAGVAARGDETLYNSQSSRAAPSVKPAYVRGIS